MTAGSIMSEKQDESSLSAFYVGLPNPMTKWKSLRKSKNISMSAPYGVSP